MHIAQKLEKSDVFQKINVFLKDKFLIISRSFYLSIYIFFSGINRGRIRHLCFLHVSKYVRHVHHNLVRSSLLPLICRPRKFQKFWRFFLRQSFETRRWFWIGQFGRAPRRIIFVPRNCLHCDLYLDCSRHQICRQSKSFCITLFCHWNIPFFKKFGGKKLAWTGHM